MTITKTACRALAGAAAAFAATLALAGAAFAAPVVQGADFHASGSVLESGEVDALTVAGGTGETVFVSVAQDGRDIAKFIPYTLGQGETRGEGDNWTGVVALDIAGFDTARLDGTYTVSAYATRAGGDPLYQGALYGVYADLPDGSSVLVGTRVIGAGDAADRTFVPDESLYVNGVSYKLTEGAAQSSDPGALHFAYQQYDAATTVDGVIRFVDQAGNVIATQAIPGLERGVPQEVAIPAAVASEGGDVYRTIFFKDSVTALNPGQVSFTVSCVKMSDAEKAAANYYVATIQLVDETGRVIATDSVNVTGVFVYTAPETIYKTELVDAAYGEQAVVTYHLAGSSAIVLDAANDGVTSRARTVQVPYVAEEPDPPTIDVTFNLIDGTKRVNDDDRVLDVVVQTVDVQNSTAVPAEAIQVEGETYNLVGEPADYAYALRSGKIPVVNAYYTPDGYEPPGSYDVTVQYVNFLTGDVVGSEVVTSSPEANSDLQIQTPATFQAGDVEYVRLDGQEDAISHNYYSGITSYTVYYRDVNDTLTSGTVINTIRVVYVDGATASGDGTAAAAAGAGTDATALQLNASRTYNVMDGDGNNATLTNEEGVDSNTERIEDEETPLAQGLDAPDAAASQSGAAAAVPGQALTISVAAAVAAIAVAIIAALVVKRRKNRDVPEA